MISFVLTGRLLMSLRKTFLELKKSFGLPYCALLELELNKPFCLILTSLFHTVNAKLDCKPSMGSRWQDKSEKIVCINDNTSKM